MQIFVPIESHAESETREVKASPRSVAVELLNETIEEIGEPYCSRSWRFDERASDKRIEILVSCSDGVLRWSILMSWFTQEDAKDSLEAYVDTDVARVPRWTQRSDGRDRQGVVAVGLFALAVGVALWSIFGLLIGIAGVGLAFALGYIVGVSIAHGMALRELDDLTVPTSVSERWDAAVRQAMSVRDGLEFRD